MGWLVGLPLGIFKILFTVVMLAVRFAVPLGVLFILWRVYRRYRADRQGWEEPPAKEPEFKGPVYEVDYKIVDEDKEG